MEGNSGRGSGCTLDAPLTRASQEDAQAMADSSTGKSPAFQFYPKDFISDEQQTAMSIAECGIYIRLLCACWTNGSIPSDLSRLHTLCGATQREMQKYWPAVSVKFVPHPTETGRLVNPRMERERAKQTEYRGRQASAATKRWQYRNNATALPPHPSGNALLSSSSSSSSSSDCSQQERASTREIPIAVKPPNGHASRPLDPSDDPVLSERAGRFCERYADMHAKYRHGARYMSKPNLDFLEALQIVRVWDDERLDKLAQAFLTTDDEWVASGTRTMARFRSRASWCDERLREAGL